MVTLKAVKSIKLITLNAESTGYKDLANLQLDEHLFEHLQEDNERAQRVLKDVDILIFDLDRQSHYQESTKANIIKGCARIIGNIPPQEGRHVVKIFVADYKHWKDHIENHSSFSNLLAPECDALTRNVQNNHVCWVKPAEWLEAFNYCRDKISGAAEIKAREERKLKIAIFKQLYKAMRNSETAWYQSFFKTNALSKMENMSDEEAEKFINAKSPTSRSSKAWKLTQKHAGVFTRKTDNLELLTELYQHSFRNSGWFSKSCNLKTEENGIFKNKTFWKSSSLDKALVNNTVYVSRVSEPPHGSRLARVNKALKDAVAAVDEDIMQREDTANAAAPAALR